MLTASCHGWTPWRSTIKATATTAFTPAERPIMPRSNPRSFVRRFREFGPEHEVIRSSEHYGFMAI